MYYHKLFQFSGSFTTAFRRFSASNTFRFTLNTSPKKPKTVAYQKPQLHNRLQPDYRTGLISVVDFGHSRRRQHEIRTDAIRHPIRRTFVMRQAAGSVLSSSDFICAEERRIIKTKIDNFLMVCMPGKDDDKHRRRRRANTHTSGEKGRASTPMQKSFPYHSCVEYLFGMCVRAGVRSCCKHNTARSIFVLIALLLMSKKGLLFIISFVHVGTSEKREIQKGMLAMLVCCPTVMNRNPDDTNIRTLDRLLSVVES